MSVLLVESAVIAALLAASMFFSGSEAAFFSLQPWQLPQEGHPGKRERLVRRLLERPGLLLVSLLLGNECVNVSLSFISSDLRTRLLPGPWGAALGVVLTTMVLVLVGEAAPKAVSATHPLEVARAYAPALDLFVRLVRRPASSLARGISRLPGRAPDSHDAIEELQHLIRAARSEGSFLKEEEKALGRILACQRDAASSIMVPRTALVFLSASADRETALAASSQGEWMVIRGRTEEDALGIASPQDVLLWALAESPRDLGKACTAVPFHPESRLLRQVFADLFEQGHPGVILTDEYGAVAGLITRERFADHIFLAGPEVPDAATGETLPGSMPYALFREHFHQAPEDARCKTLAGHVLNIAGRIPAAGESFEDGALRYTVVEATGRQVLRIVPALLEPGPPPKAPKPPR